VLTLGFIARKSAIVRSWMYVILSQVSPLLTNHLFWQPDATPVWVGKDAEVSVVGGA